MKTIDLGVSLIPEDGKLQETNNLSSLASLARPDGFKDFGYCSYCEKDEQYCECDVQREYDYWLESEKDD